MPLSYTSLTRLCSELDSELEEVMLENETYVDTIAIQREEIEHLKLIIKRRELN